MTDPEIRIEPTRLSLDPGGEVQVVVTVTNYGAIVEGFRIDLVGVGVPAWARIEPVELSVYPQQEGRSVVTIAVPSSGVPGGVVPFGVRATSVVNPTSQACAEGDLEIGQIYGLSATLSPVNSTGRLNGRHSVTIVNGGNSPAQLRLIATDPDEKLRFRLDPPVVVAMPGAAVSARVRVQPRRSMIRGQKARLPFRVVAEPDPAPPAPPGPPPPATPFGDPRRPAVEGAFTQAPILSRGLIAAMAGAAVLTLAVGAAAFAMRGEEDKPPAPIAIEAKEGPKAPLLSAAVINPPVVQLSWDRQDVDGYVLFRGGIIQQQLRGDQFQTQVPDLAPGTQPCFTLQATKNGEKAISPEVCTAIPSPTPSATASDASTPSPTTPPPTTPPPTTPPPTTPPPTNGPVDFGTDFIAYLDTYSLLESNAKLKAEEIKRFYLAQGVEADVLLSSDYPDLGGTPAYIVFVRDTTGEKASLKCQQAGPRNGACLLRQPGAPRDDAEVPPDGSA